MRPAELRAKYQEMLRLRLLHGEPNEPDPRRSMAKLAAEFPGALREIDELTMDEIRERIDALEVAEAESAPAAWMIAMARFHALMRGALCAKSWLAKRKVVDDGVRAAFAVEAAVLCWSDDARAWIDELAAIASPPNGRVTELVFTRLARELQLDETAARALVFRPRRRRASDRAT